MEKKAEQHQGTPAEAINAIMQAPCNTDAHDAVGTFMDPIDGRGKVIHKGLTKREHFAAVIAGAQCAGTRTPYDQIVSRSVEMADALIAELNRTNGVGKQKA